MSNKIKNKKGWVKIVEAFLAILLVAAVVIIVVENTNVRKEDSEKRISDAQILVLRDVQLNNTLRQDIVNTNGEIDWDDEEFPQPVKGRIEERKPVWLGCVAKICGPVSECVLSDETINDLELRGENIYTQSVMITSTIEEYEPKVLKLFCWD